MKNFFKRTKQKTQLTLILVLYIIVGSVGLSTYNCARCLEEETYTVIDRFGMTIAAPSLILAAPLGYGFVLAGEPNPFSIQLLLLMGATFFEILILYLLACVLISIEDWVRKKMKRSV